MGPKLPTSTGELSLPDFWTKKTNRGWNLTRFFRQVGGKLRLKNGPLTHRTSADIFMFFCCKTKAIPKHPKPFLQVFLVHCTWNSGCWWVLKVQTLKIPSLSERPKVQNDGTLNDGTVTTKLHQPANWNCISDWRSLKSQASSCKLSIHPILH